MHTVIEDQQNTQVAEYNLENTHSGLFYLQAFSGFWFFLAIANI